MGKHLTVEERLNANKILEDLNKEEKELRQKIRDIIIKKKKFRYFLYYSKQSKHKGLYALETDAYKQCNKSYAELTKEEIKKYNRNMKKKSRENLKEKKYDD